MGPSDIHLRAISQEIPPPSITRISFKIIYLKSTRHQWVNWLLWVILISDTVHASCCQCLRKNYTITYGLPWMMNLRKKYRIIYGLLWTRILCHEWPQKLLFMVRLKPYVIFLLHILSNWNETHMCRYRKLPLIHSMIVIVSKMATILSLSQCVSREVKITETNVWHGKVGPDDPFCKGFVKS